MNIMISIAMMMSFATCSGVKTGRLLGLDGGLYDALFEINIDTGEAKELYILSLDPSEGGLAVGPDGALYAVFSGDIDSLVIIDPLSGHIILVGPFGFDDVSGLAFGPDGTLYGFDESGPVTELITIDVQTGLGTPIGPGPISGTGLAFTSDGSLYLVGTPGLESRLYTVDPETGQTTEIGTFGHGLDGACGLESIGDVLYADAHWGDGPPHDLLVTVNRETGKA